MLAQAGLQGAVEALSHQEGPRGDHSELLAPGPGTAGFCLDSDPVAFAKRGGGELDPKWPAVGPGWLRDSERDTVVTFSR